MDGSKIKNFIICLLLAVNLLFLALVIARDAQAARLERQVREDLQAILSQNSVSMDMDLLPETEDYPAYVLSRDADSEAALAAAILGPVEGEDQGGNIFYYENQAGWARFRGSGEFEIVPAKAISGEGKAESELAREILAQLSLSTRDDFTREHRDSQSILTYPCLLEDESIYDCFVSLHFENGDLVSISGRRPIGPGSRSGENLELNPATALLSLLSYTRQSGHVFSAVTGLQAGYMMQVSVSGNAELVPIWQIQTDSGAFYVNSRTLSISLQPA